MRTQTTNNVAVFFDFENIAISLHHQSHQNPNFKALMDRCRHYGRVILARAYADWGSHHNVVYALYASGFAPVYVPTYSYGGNGQHPPKNAVDIHMAIEAMEVLHTCRHVNTFILMTGDKDFVPLALKLRREGKQVIAFAVEKTASNYLHDAVDEIVFYGQILKHKPPGQTPAVLLESKPKSEKPTTLQAAFSLLQQTVNQAQAAGKSLYAGPIKNLILQQQPDFDEKQLQNGDGRKFRRFSDFVRAAASAGIVRVVEQDHQPLIYPAVTRGAETPATDATETETALPVATTAPIPEPQPPSTKGTTPAVADLNQQLILDALHTCQYPATLDEIGRHCQQARETQQAPLPNRHIWELVRNAIDAGSLRAAVGMPPGYYELADDRRNHQSA